MLAVKSYPTEYVERCRVQFEAIVKGFAAVENFPDGLESRIFNELVLALDNKFCHRMRGQEGKDGNPLNEVRMLAASIMNSDAVLAADSTIKYVPEKTILGYAIGNQIALDAAGFGRLANAFLDEIGRKFPS
jgi:hypothetical protein